MGQSGAALGRPIRRPCDSAGRASDGRHAHAGERPEEQPRHWCPSTGCRAESHRTFITGTGQSDHDVSGD